MPHGAAVRSALITGGGRGIGLAIAQRLSRDGFNVAIADVDGAAAVAAVSSLVGRGLALECDVTEPEDVRRAHKAILGEFGQIDSLVHNVGVSREVAISSMTIGDWDAQVLGTLTSAFVVAQEFLPDLVELRGNLTFIGSVNGISAYGHEAYSAAKAGLNSLAQNLCLSYGPFGVRVNVIAPGSIRTEAWHKDGEDRRLEVDTLAEHYPLGRVGTPEDVASAASFIVSSDAAWITGVVLPVDGGLTAGNFAFVRARTASLAP